MSHFYDWQTTRASRTTGRRTVRLQPKARRITSTRMQVIQSKSRNNSCGDHSPSAMKFLDISPDSSQHAYPTRAFPHHILILQYTRMHDTAKHQHSPKLKLVMNNFPPTFGQFPDISVTAAKFPDISGFSGEVVTRQPVPCKAAHFTTTHIILRQTS